MTGPVNILKAKHLPLLGLAEIANPDELICLRPEQIKLDDTGVSGIVRAVYFKGSHYEIELNVSRYVSLRLLTTRTDLRVGQRTGIRVADESIWRF